MIRRRGVDPDASPDASGRRFRPDVQGLRAIAVVLVIVFHSGVGLSGGFLGVDVFFVISGFVIGRMLLAERESTGRIAFGRFYARRIRRLVPPLVVMLVFVAAVSIVAISPIDTMRTITRNTGISAALYLANFGIMKFQSVGYFDLGATDNPLLHTWTLGVEEQFYLFFPLFLVLLAWIAGRIRIDRRRVVLGGVVIAAVVSFLVGASMTSSFGYDIGPFGAHGRFAFYSSPTRAWEFLAGVIVASWEAAALGLPRRVARVGVVIGLVAIIGAAFVVHGSAATPGFSTLLPVGGAALVILCAAAESGPIAGLLSSRPMVWIGDRSYGWYLWHWPLIVFVRMSFPAVPAWVLLAVGIVALVPTELSYRFVENPIRHDPAWLGRRAVATALAGSLLASVAFVGLVAFPEVSEANVAPARAALQQGVPAPQLCYPTGAHDDPNAKASCVWKVPHPKGTIVLIGDSHAWAIAPVMISEANRAGYDINMLFRPGCPFADVVRVDSDPRDRKMCAEFVKGNTTWIELTRPSLVILVSNEDTYVSANNYRLRDPVTGETAADPASRAAVWRDGLTRTLHGIVATGVPTVVVSTVPQIPPFELRLCPAWRLWTDPPGCARTLPRTTVDQNQALGRRATREAVDAVPGSTLVDFEDELCGATTCSTWYHRRWTYRDDTHVSHFGSELLYRQVRADVIPRARP
ncbi:MAG: acyltransferase [Actinobacteria bacterium]|nr:acyltransferase [Actinomycetota bacterium]